MKAESLKKFERLFQEAQAKLTYSQGIQVEPFSLAEDDRPDEGDQTRTELETAMRLRLRSREALYLKKLNQAQARIHAGTFGTCLDCGDEIEMKRLELRPTAELCVGCKEDQEHREWQHVDGHRPKSLGRALKLA